MHHPPTRAAVTSATSVSQLPPSSAMSAAVSLSSCSRRAMATIAVPPCGSALTRSIDRVRCFPVTMATDGACMSLQVDRRSRLASQAAPKCRPGPVACQRAQRDPCHQVSADRSSRARGAHSGDSPTKRCVSRFQRVSGRRSDASTRVPPSLVADPLLSNLCSPALTLPGDSRRDPRARHRSRPHSLWVRSRRRPRRGRFGGVDGRDPHARLRSPAAPAGCLARRDRRLARAVPAATWSPSSRCSSRSTCAPR